MSLRWRAALPHRAWPDAHQVLESLNLVSFDLDSPLPLGATLEVVDGNRATTKGERTGVRLGEPVVKGRPGDAQSSGGLSSCQKLVFHRRMAHCASGLRKGLAQSRWKQES